MSSVNRFWRRAKLALAVSLASTPTWGVSFNVGPVEGQISRLKAIKRSMYGRAGFTLLRSGGLSTA